MRASRSAIPLVEGTLVGPLIDERRLHGEWRRRWPRRARWAASCTGGERVAVAGAEGGFYVRPALVEMPEQAGPVLNETFAPILYVLKYRDFDDAIARHNGVRQGLSSSIFTLDMREAETFLSVAAARIAASPTSTSARRAPKSAAPSAARRRPAAAANPAPTPGRPTCGAPPTPSTTARRCRWRRACASKSSRF